MVNFLFFLIVIVFGYGDHFCAFCEILWHRFHETFFQVELVNFWFFHSFTKINELKATKNSQNELI